jgi:two-component system, OmpR family, phosphate regulon sensor histidine kinase PhoR
VKLSGFRTQLFAAAAAVAAICLLVAGPLISTAARRLMMARLEQTLTTLTRLAADLLSRHPAGATPAQLDAEADRLGSLIGARVTILDASGLVVGDSSADLASLESLENHADQPEVVRARQQGLGLASRYSPAARADLIYAAAPVQHPSIAFVRLAMPLGQLDEQLRTLGNGLLIALFVALATAFGLAGITSARLGRRVQAVSAIARRYGEGRVTPPAGEYGDDELGTVAKAFDDSVQVLGRQVGELERDRARMAAILTGMVEGVLVVDEQGRLQLVNDAARRMLKLEGDATGRHYIEAMRHPGIAALLRGALAGGRPEGLEIAPPADSRVFVARAAPAPSAAGNGAVLVLHDITDLRRADQIRRDFVANVSHELRTPLTAIRGYVEALMEEGVDPESTRRFLEVIARHSLRMERLVRDLLRLARLDAGQEPLELVECEVSTLFSGVITELASPIESHGHTVTTAIEPQASTIVGDPAKLHDVLRNLVENAINYSPDGSRIELRAGRNGTDIVLTVADSGPGLPEKDLARVFERFYRVDKSRVREPGGTGLGLSIVKHLIGLHGGRVDAANRPQGGAVFTVRIPVRQV